MGMIDVHQLRLFGIDGTHNAALKVVQRCTHAVEENFEPGTAFGMSPNLAPLISRQSSQ